LIEREALTAISKHESTPYLRHLPRRPFRARELRPRAAPLRVEDGRAVRRQKYSPPFFRRHFIRRFVKVVAKAEICSSKRMYCFFFEGGLPAVGQFPYRASFFALKSRMLKKVKKKCLAYSKSLDEPPNGRMINSNICTA
jgi:hypothetical protein